MRCGVPVAAEGEQLFFDLPLVPASARDDLVVAPANRLAVEHIDVWPGWNAPVTILTGPQGAGKSHLARIWSLHSGAGHLSREDIAASPGFRGDRSFVFEDIDAAPFDEAGLFHLLNATRAAGVFALITSRTRPANWNIKTPDLASRLKAATLVEIGEPDDALLHGVLLKLFADRQLAVDPNVVGYLLIRMERSLSAAAEIVRRLDYLSLARQRPVTRLLAADALAMSGSGGVPAD